MTGEYMTDKQLHDACQIISKALKADNLQPHEIKYALIGAVDAVTAMIINTNRIAHALETLAHIEERRYSRDGK